MQRLLLCGTKPQLVAFGLKGHSIILRRFLAWSPTWNSCACTLHKCGLRSTMSWSLKEYPTCKPDAIDFPVGEHMPMLHLLLELRSILVEALGRVPKPEQTMLQSVSLC